MGYNEIVLILSFAVMLLLKPLEFVYVYDIRILFDEENMI